MEPVPSLLERMKLLQKENAEFREKFNAHERLIAVLQKNLTELSDAVGVSFGAHTDTPPRPVTQYTTSPTNSVLATAPEAHETTTTGSINQEDDCHATVGLSSTVHDGDTARVQAQHESQPEGQSSQAASAREVRHAGTNTDDPHPRVSQLGQGFGRSFMLPFHQLGIPYEASITLNPPIITSGYSDYHGTKRSVETQVQTDTNGDLDGVHYAQYHSEEEDPSPGTPRTELGEVSRLFTCTTAPRDVEMSSSHPQLGVPIAIVKPNVHTRRAAKRARRLE